MTKLALFLDLDGTLIPFVNAPDDIGPDRNRSILLCRLQKVMEGRLAVVSGRCLADIDRILEGGVTCVAGSHGLQRRGFSLGVTQAAPAPGLEQATGECLTMARRWAGTMVERKPLSTAVHYRNAPDFEGKLKAKIETVALRTGLEVQHGNKVCELKSPGPSMGDAVRTFLNEVPFLSVMI
jgi:trehalose 6-phosphate phosphatase